MQYTLEEVTVSKSFWILWQPNSNKPPTVKFHNYTEAEKAASTMATAHGVPFYVMRASALVEPVLAPIKVTALV